MEPTAVWITYTLMFGYPVPTRDEHELTNQSACVIHMRSYTQEIIDAFQLVCARRSIALSAGQGQLVNPGSMSPYGTKRTSQQFVSSFGGKADVGLTSVMSAFDPKRTWEL